MYLRVYEVLSVSLGLVLIPCVNALACQCFDDPSPSQRVTHTTGMTHLKVVEKQFASDVLKLYCPFRSYSKPVPR